MLWQPLLEEHTWILFRRKNEVAPTPGKDPGCADALGLRIGHGVFVRTEAARATGKWNQVTETRELTQSKEKEEEITVMEQYPCSPVVRQKWKSKKNGGAAEGSANRTSGSQLTSSVLSRTIWKYLLISQMHTQDDPTAPLFSNHLRQLSTHILGRHIPESASQQCNKGTKQNLSTHHQQENSWINREIPIRWIPYLLCCSIKTR